MKDFTGQELSVGDKVAYVQSGYVGLYAGVILKITPKGVKVGRDHRASGVFRYGREVILLEPKKPPYILNDKGRCAECDGWGCPKCKPETTD